MTTKKEQVLEQLKKNGELTSLEIQQLVWTTCPHGIIRDIRREYGFNSIESKNCFKRRKYIDDKGKERTEFTSWVKYIWRG